MGFVILGAAGDDTRYFYDFLSGQWESELIIYWNHAPPPPSGGESTLNQTYRDLNIWEVDWNGANRTGSPNSPTRVNWNTLNVSRLTEIDSGASIVRVNETYTTLTSFVAQEWSSVYNDSGAQTLIELFVRCRLNLIEVTDALGVVDVIPSVMGIGNATPVGGGGLAYGANGRWAGLITQVSADDLSYRFRLRQRTFGIGSNGAASQWFTENSGSLYIEYRWVDDASYTFHEVRIYDDPAFTNLIWTDQDILTDGIAPMRYPAIVSSLASGTSRWNTGRYYTYLTNPLADNVSWAVTFQNGTLLGDFETLDDALAWADDYLDPDPLDPDPPSQGWDTEGAFTRFRTRLYIWCIGVFMIFGPLIVFAYRRPSGYQFVIGAFIMLIGLAFMIQAGYV